MFHPTMSAIGWDLMKDLIDQGNFILVHKTEEREYVFSIIKDGVVSVGRGKRMVEAFTEAALKAAPVD